MVKVTLEAFSRLHQLPLEFIRVETVKDVNFASFRKKKRIKDVRWDVSLHSRFLCQSVFIQEIFPNGLSAGGSLFPGEGSSRKEARKNLLKKICGKTILLGYGRDVKIRVPKNLV